MLLIKEYESIECSPLCTTQAELRLNHCGSWSWLNYDNNQDQVNQQNI